MATPEELKELLRNLDTEQNVVLKIITPSSVMFCKLQDLQCQFTQDICMIVGAITAVGLYFAIKSSIEKHHAKKIAIERGENVLSLYEGIRNRKMVIKCHTN